MADERYSEDEVAAILKRSAQIEAERRQAGEAPRLSLADLEDIARESGLDPSAVRAAAEELSRNGRVATAEAPLPVAAAASGVDLLHRRVLGGELADAELERLVERAGLQLRLTGELTRRPDGWQWSERSGRRRVQVVATARNGRTQVEIGETLRRLHGSLRGGLIGGLTAAGLAFGFVFGANVESSLSGAFVMSAVMSVSGLAAGFGFSGMLFRQLRQARDLELQRVLTDLETTALEWLDRERPAPTVHRDGASNREPEGGARSREADRDCG